MNEAKDFCYQAGKPRYGKLKKAKTALSVAKANAKKHGRVSPDLDIYRCQFCRGFHLTRCDYEAFPDPPLDTE